LKQNTTKFGTVSNKSGVEAWTVRNTVW